MRATITFEKAPFENINAPKVGRHFLYNQDKLYPDGLMFNKVYYMLHDGNTLRAFKIIAFAAEGDNENPYSVKLMMLVVYPDGNQEWVDTHILKNKKIFPSKESYLDGAKRNIDTSVTIVWVALGRILPELKYCAVVGCKYNVFKWKDGMPSEVESVDMNYLVINKDGAYVSIEKRDNNGANVYLSRESCLQENLNGLIIDDFCEEEITFKVHTSGRVTYKIEII